MGESADDKPKKDRPWIFRTYAGHSTAEKSNALYRQNSARARRACPSPSISRPRPATIPTTRWLRVRSGRSVYRFLISATCERC